MFDKEQYKAEYQKLKDIVNTKLDEYIPVKYPEEIYESMKYSVNAGGKRLRPVIALEVCKMLCGKYEQAIPTSCAIEMLHTQSLIHDDLPCMDNDDYRRGKLTNHKAFSEATAVLAGDALISYGIKLIIDKTPKEVSAEKLVQIINEYCIAAGVDGIIAGQIVDIDSENKKISAETLDFIHEYKTAKMFEFPVKAGAILGGADEKQLEELEKFATTLGHAFQIYDDILDEIATLEELGKTPGKDANANKATYTSFYGLEKAKCKVLELCTTCCDILDKNNIKSAILEGIVFDIKKRID
ncbi:MAG: polyprenyl synthetase family protein [Candidatus Gastranaerophilales bacterium]|nr:polyprenyl synthetase family protein [Candidatus Gastranaerophilales bacterium]